MRPSILITVNNAGYQAMIDLNACAPSRPTRSVTPPSSEAEPVRHPVPAAPKQPRKALIVGAGSGNDAAGALRNGVEQVTAVEIDPVIIDCGRRYHPERPYDSPRVTLVNDDARSYFATSRDQVRRHLVRLARLAHDDRA